MASSPTSEASDTLDPLRTAVRGHAGRPGLAVILPMLQQGHRRELRREPHWSKEELVRHPEPRELIRSMRKPGNLDIEGRPVYTLDERRLLTADIYENRMVRERGIWKISRMDLDYTFSAPYSTGWARVAERAARPAAPAAAPAPAPATPPRVMPPPDGPLRGVTVPPYPGLATMAFHYRNPVSGRDPPELLSP